MRDFQFPSDDLTNRRQLLARCGGGAGMLGLAALLANEGLLTASAAGPAWGQAAAAPVVTQVGRGSAWRMLRVTPARAAIAATVLVVLGVSLTYSRTALDTETTKATHGEPAAPAIPPRDRRPRWPAPLPRCPLGRA